MDVTSMYPHVMCVFDFSISIPKILTLIGLGTQDHNFFALEGKQVLWYLKYTCITEHYLNMMLS